MSGTSLLNIVSQFQGTTPATQAGEITLTTPKAAEIAATFLRAKTEEEATKARLDVACEDLRTVARRAYFEGNHGRHDPESSVYIPAAGGGTARVTFMAVWRSESGVDLIPADLRCEAVRGRIAFDQIPSDKAPAFLQGVLQLAHSLGLDDAVKISGGLRPVPSFNLLRHTRLSVQENMHLEDVGLGTQANCCVGRGRGK